MKELKYEVDDPEKYIGLLKALISMIDKWDYYSSPTVRSDVITIYENLFFSLFGPDVYHEQMETPGWWYHFTYLDGMRIECCSKDDPESWQRRMKDEDISIR